MFKIYVGQRTLSAQNHRRGNSYFNSDVEAYANDAVVGMKAFDMSNIADAATALSKYNILLNLTHSFPIITHITITIPRCGRSGSQFHQEQVSLSQEIHLSL